MNETTLSKMELAMEEPPLARRNRSLTLWLLEHANEPLVFRLNNTLPGDPTEIVVQRVLGADLVEGRRGYGWVVFENSGGGLDVLSLGKISAVFRQVPELDPAPER